MSFPAGTLPSTYRALASTGEVNFALVLEGIFVTCYVVTSLGYFIDQAKSILFPQKQVPYLGFIIDSEREAFSLLPNK